MSDEAKKDEEVKTVTEIASLGGKAAAKKMTRTERSERAKKAAETRWHGTVLKATHGSPEHPLMIGEIPIPCYVLENGQRVVVQSGMIEALGMTKGGSSHKGGTRLAKFVGGSRLKQFVTEELIKRTQEPIRFATTTGTLAFGFDAEIIADICEAVLEANKQNLLQAQQKHIAERCWVLYRGFARVGIVALIDEATGYQDARQRDALAKILEAFIAKELQPYIRTFEADYYKAICVLKGWEYKTSSRRPRVLGRITNDIVYSRLAPSVLEKLREKNPVVKGGRRSAKHFQWLTDNKGYPDLRAHLQRITGWMEVSRSWDEFYLILNERKPVYRTPKAVTPGLFDDLPDEPDEAIATPSSSNALPLPSAQSPPAAPV